MPYKRIPPFQYITLSDIDRSPSKITPEVNQIIEMINQKIMASESLDAVMNFYYEASQRIFPCDRLGLAFLDEDGLRLTSHWLRTEYETVLLDKGYTEDLQGSSLSDVIRSGTPRIINDLDAYFTAHPNSRSTRLLLAEGVRSNMTCPLKVEGRNVGLLFRSSRSTNMYSTLEINRHLALTQRLSQAIEKVYRIEQLTAANTAYFEMLGFVSHELKSPISSVVMDAKLMTEGYLGEMTPDQKSRIEKIARKGEYLLGLVREYLDLARIESQQLEPRLVTIDFREIIEMAIEVIHPQIEDKKMRIVMEGTDHPMPVECDPDLMKIVMVNLLGNGVKYGFAEGEIRIESARTPSAFLVSVRNDGPGFPETQRSRLFRKFSRLQTPESKKEKGTGVGLYSVYRIIQAHHGHIRAESEHGKWAQFSIEIPQPVSAEEHPQEGASS